MNLLLFQSKWLLAQLSRKELQETIQEVVDARQEGWLVLDGIEESLLTKEEIDNLIEEFLKVQNSGRLSKLEALKIYTTHIANQILSKTIEPYLGARAIWAASLKAKIAGYHGVDPFIYAASELEDRPRERVFFEAAIVEEAQQWMKEMNSTMNSNPWSL